MTIKEIYEHTHSKSLLYIEDDMHLRNKMKQLFESLFSRVDVASDGEEGMDIYSDYHFNKREFYDIVITDIKMPRMDGVELAKEILKQNEEQIIVVTSAHGEKENLIPLLNMGITFFIEKPLNTKTLIDTFSKICSRENKKIVLKHGFSFNLEEKKLFHNDNPIALSATESRLLYLLTKNPNTFFSAHDIHNEIYHDNADKTLSSDSLKGLLKRLRQKTYKELINYQSTHGYSINLN